MDFKNGVPKYIQIKNTLLETIEKESYQPGQQLPSENELMNQAGVSRNTVRQAIDELVKEGILVKRRGSGTFYQGRRTRSRSKAKVIGVINHYVLGTIYPEIIRGIEDVIHKNDYSLILANCNRDPQKELVSLRRMMEQNIAGLIIEPTVSDHKLLNKQERLFQAVSRMNIPVVTTNCHIRNHDLSSVTIDDIQAGYTAANYFLDRGHKRIAVVYKKEVAAGELRCEGFIQALEEKNISLDKKLLIGFPDADEEKLPGYYYTKQLMALKEARPTGIFFYNDLIALQSYAACKELGLSIPADLSIMGFDNLVQSNLVSPPLTTFEHPKYKMGKWAARILFEEINEEDTILHRNLFIRPFLIERSSVARLNH